MQWFPRNLSLPTDDRRQGQMSYSVIGLPIYAFLFMFNSNIRPNSAPLRDVRFQNLGDLDIDLSRSLRSNVIIPMDSPYYAFLLIFNGVIWPTSSPLQDAKIRNLSDLDLT